MDKKTIGYLRKVVERTKDFDALLSLDTLVGVAFDLQKENEQLKADRLEMAKEIIYSSNKASSYQLSKAKPNQCIDFISNSLGGVHDKAEQIIKESK